jgi:hypothetical protein
MQHDVKITPLWHNGRVFLIEGIDGLSPHVLKFSPFAPNQGEAINELDKLIIIEEQRPVLDKYHIETPLIVREKELIDIFVKNFQQSDFAFPDKSLYQPILQTLANGLILGEAGISAKNGNLSVVLPMDGYRDFFEDYKKFRKEVGISHNDFIGPNITANQSGQFGLIDWGNCKIRDIDGQDSFEAACSYDDLMHEMANTKIVDLIEMNNRRLMKAPKPFSP